MSGLFENNGGIKCTQLRGFPTPHWYNEYRGRDDPENIQQKSRTLASLPTFICFFNSFRDTHLPPYFLFPIFPLKHTDGSSILDEFPGARSTSAGDRGVFFRDHLEDLGGSSLGYVASNPLGGPVWEGEYVQSPNPKESETVEQLT